VPSFCLRETKKPAIPGATMLPL